MSNTPSSAEPLLIIFDLDGTVLDTIADLTDAVCEALAENGFAPRSCDEVMSFVGNGVLKLCERALPDGEKTPENIERVYAALNRSYAAHYADKTRPYPGTDRLLKDLRACGHKLAVLSNKPDPFTRELIEKFYPGLFDFVRGSREGVPRKPDPTAELEIISEAGFLPERCVHVGDSGTDVETAKNAGIKCVACSWGYRSAESLKAAGAKVIVHDMDGLRKIFFANS